MPIRRALSATRLFYQWSLIGPSTAPLTVVDRFPPSGTLSRYPSRSVSVLCLTDTLDAVNRRHEPVESKLGDVASRTGRIALITVGVIALIIGGVFAGQGMNLIPGSFMTGSRMWLSIGLIVAIVGVILIVLGLRRPGHGRTSK